VKVAVELAFLTLSGDSALANQPASVGVEIAVELALIPLSCKKTLLLLPPTTTTITTTIIIIKHLQIKWYGCCMAYIYIYIYSRNHDENDFSTSHYPTSILHQDT
jgi:hypothetical protein